MRGLLLVLSLFALAATVTKVTCITNEEFFNLSKDFATDIEVFDIAENDNDDVESDDVITLPGGPDDEVDFDYILMKLGMHFSNDTTGIEEKTTNLWWHHHHHHHHHHHTPAFSCSCHRLSCKCCLHHTFRVNLWVHKIKYTLHACLEAAYLRSNMGFELTFTLNNRRLFHKEISLRHPPALCYGVPGLRRFARVCLELYDINLASKHICARLTGVIDLKFKKFRVHLKLGCFNIPMLDSDAFQLMLNNPDFLKIKPLDDAPSHDLASLFRGLQESQTDEYDLV